MNFSGPVNSSGTHVPSPAGRKPLSLGSREFLEDGKVCAGRFILVDDLAETRQQVTRGLDVRGRVVLGDVVPGLIGLAQVLLRHRADLAIIRLVERVPDFDHIDLPLRLLVSVRGRPLG